MEYKKTSKDNLESWKKLLSAEDAIKLDSDLDDYAWYSVIDNKKIVAVFQIINVIDIYSKNLDIKFSPATRKDDMGTIKIVIFIYQSMLKICEDDKINKIKIHTHDPMMNFIFQTLSNEYEDNEKIGSVKKYGKWIEISL